MSVWLLINDHLVATTASVLAYLVEIALLLINAKTSGSKLFIVKTDKRLCEGCFCYIATRCAEGDHYVDLDLERDSQTQNSTKGPIFGPRASGILPKSIFKSQDNKAQIKWE